MSWCQEVKGQHGSYTCLGRGDQQRSVVKTATGSSAGGKGVCLSALGIVVKGLRTAVKDRTRRGAPAVVIKGCRLQQYSKATAYLVRPAFQLGSRRLPQRRSQLDFGFLVGGETSVLLQCLGVTSGWHVRSACVKAGTIF
ncbi:hypothetical protein E2C01_045934 [Portunus trituberculatus]|uniref:Uncharacterized protein n=1 Tax=Portunus trituberculatus TaxID=210409 RepID=A0A5B7FZK4_PORTR|nr:hypothetical protein [Portunus trituberculatus]